MPHYDCDILIVGGGPAGSSAALAAASRGLRVLVAERRAAIGVPVQCAEYIPAALLSELVFKPASIVQQTAGMWTVLPNGEKKYTRAPGFTIDRDHFDRELAAMARDAGATYLMSTCALTCSEETVTLRRRNCSRRIYLQPRVIIGADGPFSTVGGWMESVNRNRIPAVQVQVPLRNSLNDTEIYFDHDIFGGYGWLFPKGRVANVGLGCQRRESNSVPLTVLLENFLAFLAKEGKIEPRIIGRTSGWIPAEQPRSIRKDQIVLAGDAAGHTHAVTGAGIAQAVIGGKLAGTWARRSVRHRDLALLAEYEADWLEDYGRMLSKAYRRRVKLERGWHSLDAVIKSCWVAYREYHAAA